MEKKVIILDDSEIALELARAALEKRGYTVLTCLTVLEFERVIPRSNAQAIVIDINMPEMYGDDVCFIFKENFGIKDTPFILFSDINEDELKEKAKTSGADAYVCKKWGGDKLGQVVDEVVKNKQKTQ